MTATFSYRAGKPYAHISSAADIPDVIARMQQMGGEALLRIPMLQAVQRGIIAFLDVDQLTTGRMVKVFLGAVRLPAVIIIADDGDTPTGPDGIPNLQRVLRWATHVVIHEAAGRVEDYRGIVMAAAVSRRLVLIECPSRLVMPYKAATSRWAPRAIVKVVLPAGGTLHPSLSSREPLQ